MAAGVPESSVPGAADQILDVQQTTCCVVGGGPAGMMLSLLLARRGVPVTLLEAHHDFDRNFRGDTLHPALLEILDEIGLAGRLLQLPHVKWYGPTLLTAAGPFSPVDFSRLSSKFPFMAVIPQERFLEFLAAEATHYPQLRIVMGANVQRLVEDAAGVRGVRYQGPGGLARGARRPDGRRRRSLLQGATPCGLHPRQDVAADAHPLVPATPVA